jgi:galactose-1-phosphate uridylyltransferase
MPEPAYLMTMGDGTIKQINPTTGTRVWTVTGRSSRPLTHPEMESRPVSDTDWTHGCAFCSARYMETPPEKARMVLDGTRWRMMEHLPAEKLFSTVAEFRVVPNLFEIVSYDYWHENYGYELPPDMVEHKRVYLSTEQGRRHVLAVQSAKLRQAGKSSDEIAAMSQDELLDQADAFFGGGHDVVIARKHWVDGAKTTAQLASSGTLTPDEHEQYIQLTLHAMANLYANNRYARYVAVFQNWLKPAGASCDHLHKQLVAIDEHGANADQVVHRLRENPNFFNECGVNYATYHNLLVAENDSAIAYAGFGHRYPTIELYSKSPQVHPWRQSAEEVRDMSDLIQAVHAATGSAVPSNEEWHHVPVDVDVPMPWRINIKWRISTVAGFEGDTKIYINTVSPAEISQVVTSRLRELRQSGVIADMRIGEECTGEPNPLRYRFAIS